MRIQIRLTPPRLSLPGLLFLVAVGALSLPATTSAAPPPNATSKARVVLLGFDGADPHLVEQWMDAGLLPNMDRLRREGVYTRLGTTTPPQTPVSWTTFSTGRNPGEHGIFDFLSRDRKTYQPGYAMFDVGQKPVGLGRLNAPVGGALLALLFGGLTLLLTRRARPRIAGRLAAVVVAAGVFVLAGLAIARYVPAHRPTVTRKTAGDTFWERAGKAGLKTRVIRVPAMFPPNPVENGEILCGVGVPDIRGTNMAYLYYTTEPRVGSDENTEKGGRVIQVAFLNGETDTRIDGPRNKLFDGRPDVTVPLHIRVNRADSPPSVTLTAGGQTLTVKEREWSPWVRLQFPFNRFIKAAGITRFYLNSVEPFGLYLAPINLDPEKPVLQVSWPAGFSRDLARRFGLYKTLGWYNDTFAMDEDVLDEKAFLEDIGLTLGAFEPMMDQLLTEGDLDLYVHVFDFTDRVAHMFWRTLDPESPSADPARDAPWRNTILDTYRKMDEIVGRARAAMSPDGILFVISDHGFNTWHKAVNYNTWLVKNGFMTLKTSRPGEPFNLDDLFGQGQFWPNVDWSKTRAYAMGLGSLYVNLKGREAQGCVLPSEYEALRDSLVHGLEALVDTAYGEHPVRHVYRREKVYRSFDPDLIPDLFIANNSKYRVSWQTSLGGIPANLFEINGKKWSGDHCSFDQEITRGIFLCNRRLDAEGATMLDFYPTILSELGVPVPANVEGRVLRELPRE